MKIATFNANSIRVRLETILDWLAEFEPDVLAIQETKCEDSQFPIDPFEELGWHVTFDGQKSYNGVAIVSRNPAQDVIKGFGDPAFPDDKRVLIATINGVRIVNTYVPNGNKVGSEKFAYKLSWLERAALLLQSELTRHPNLVWLGDINIAPGELDVFEHEKHLGNVCHHPEEFARLDKIKALGLTDLFREVNKEPGQYTYWDFVIPRSVDRNLGWRIDHLYGSAAMKERLETVIIDIEPRKSERPSDHTFVMATFVE